MSFASLTAQLNLNISNFSRGLSTASRQMRQFANDSYKNYGLAAAALNKHNLHLKDTVRIIHGIVIAQTFYNAVGAISNATAALWNFNQALDYMQVTYSALFGDSDLASDFMTALQEHSINTIFDYQGLADASKKLLAYGIEYKNLMFIMNGLTDLGAMSGDADSLTRISRALGQIYTKGKLSAEEMRQLADAYVPIYEIVQSSFGLTDDQMGRVGDLNLPAHEVINAIIDYANAEFGSVGEAAMYTITGLENRVVDTLKVLGTAMLKPVTTAYKSFLAYAADGLNEIRDEFETGGFGGVFEHLVPDPNTQQTIRQFIANVRNLFMSLMSVGAVVGQVFGNFASVLATAFNIAAPLITGFVNVLSGLLNAFLQTRTGATLLRIALIGAAGAFIVLKVHAVAALVITAVTKAVIGLAKALMLLASLITKHPILSLLAGLAVTLVGVSSASTGANKSISSLFDTLSGGLGGSSSDDVLQRTEQGLLDGADAADQFNNRLEESAGAAKDVEDAVGGAGKAAKDAAKKVAGLLSFDEVFRLHDPSKSSGSGGGSGGGIDAAYDGLEGLIDDFGGLSDALIPEIPDFSEYISDFTDGLFGGVSKGIFDRIASSPGLLIGAGAGIAGAIAKAFGGSIGAVLKTFVNTGSFAGFFKSIGSIFSATGLKAIAKGGIIGAAIGLVVDGLATMLWGSLAERFESANTETAAVGQTIGSILGAIIGGLLGGPPGAIIGSAIGTFAGGFVGLFWEPIAEYFDPENNVLTRFFVDTGKQLGDWATDTLAGLGAWWVDTYTGFSTWFSDTASGFSTWWGDTTSGFSTWWDDTKSGLSSWWDDTVKTFSDWDSINSDTLGDWWSRTSTGFSDWASRTFNSVDEWTSGTLSSIVDWGVSTYNSFAGWVGDTFLEFANWRDDTRNGFDAWKREAFAPIRNWCSDALNAIGEWALNALAKFNTWFLETKSKFDNFKEDVKAVFEGIMVAIGKAIDDGLGSVADSIGNFFGIDNLWQLIKDGVDGITRKLKSWWEGIGNIFSGDIDVSPTVNVNPSRSNGRQSMAGHARGGIFDREHIARFAEGNKAEAIIPLENPGAMKPFVDAVSGGLISTLAPVLASASATPANTLPPLYVGTLIADDRGIEQLYRKFEIIQLQENDRKGTPNR